MPGELKVSMTQNRSFSQWNRGQVHWAKKPSHLESPPSSSRNSSMREPSKDDARNWRDTGSPEQNGACWELPLKFTGQFREEFRKVFDWDDSEAKEVYFAAEEAEKKSPRREKGHHDLFSVNEAASVYSPQVDWDTRRACNLSECAETLIREENKKKGRGSFAKKEQSRLGSPVIIGLPGGGDSDDGEVSPIHLPLFAVPQPTGWGDEGDVVPPSSGWGDKGNVGPPCSGWGDSGNVAPPYSGWGDIDNAAAPASGWVDIGDVPPTGSGWENTGNVAPPSSGWEVTGNITSPGTGWGETRNDNSGVSGWDDTWVRSKKAAPFQSSVASGPGEVGTKTKVSGWNGVAAEHQECEWAPLTNDVPVATGWEEDSLDNTNFHNESVWMQRPTYPDNPHSYNHIVPSGWGDFSDETGPSPDVEMEPCNNAWEGSKAVYEVRLSRGSGWNGAGWDSSSGNVTVQHENQRSDYCRAKYGPGSWKPKKDGETYSSFEPHWRRSFQRPGRTPIANNLRVNQDSKPSRGSRWERTKTTVWQAAGALSHEINTKIRT